MAASLLRRFDPYSRPAGEGPADSELLTLLGRPLQISLAVAPKQLKQ